MAEVNDTGLPTIARPWLVNEVAEHFRVCSKTVRERIKRRQISVIRIGRKILVPDAEVRRLAEHGLG